MCSPPPLQFPQPLLSLCPLEQHRIAAEGVEDVGEVGDHLEGDVLLLDAALVPRVGVADDDVRGGGAVGGGGRQGVDALAGHLKIEISILLRKAIVW